MIKNKDRIVQYLIECKFVEQSMTANVWLKQYDTIDCCVNLSGAKIVIEWYPHGDYSRKSVDISTQPELLNLKTILLNISKTNHLPSIFDVPAEPATQATETPDLSHPEVDVSAEPANESGPTSTDMDPPATLDPATSGEDVGQPIGNSVLPVPLFLKKDKSAVPAPSAPAPKSKKKPDSVIPPVTPAETPASAGGVPAMKEPNSLLNKTHDELDRIINDDKARRWLEERGSSYKVHGNERPDAASIQRISNMRGVSTAVISAVQTKEYAEATVRAYLGNIYVDSVVHHDFENHRRMLILERMKKNPDILDGWNGEMPIIRAGAKIKNASGNLEDARYTIMHSHFAFIEFALRDAVTKAEASAQAKILNQEFREPEDIESEQFEVGLVRGR